MKLIMKLIQKCFISMFYFTTRNNCVYIVILQAITQCYAWCYAILLLLYYCC